jgi:hypothetical protein
MKNAIGIGIIIISILLMISGSTFGSTPGALGMTPGSVAFTSGKESSYTDSTSGSQALFTGQLGLALNKMPIFGQLGMASGSETLLFEQAGPASKAGIYTPSQGQTTLTYSTVSPPVLNHRLSSKDFQAHVMRPTILLGSIFHPPTVIIP